jgi:hypothetical protein
MAQQMARMMNKSMKAGIGGSLFGAASAGIALLLFAVTACCMM